MSEDIYISALSEVYTLALRSKGKRERRTIQICRAVLGERVCRLLDAEDAARHAAAKVDAGRRNVGAANATPLPRPQ
jgi:hypothetical protein